MFQNCALQNIREISSLVEKTSRPVLVLCDGRPPAKERMIVIRQSLRMFRHQKFGPVHCLVIRAGMEWIVLQCQRMLQIRELRIAEPRGPPRGPRGPPPPP